MTMGVHNGRVHRFVTVRNGLGSHTLNHLVDFGFVPVAQQPTDIGGLECVFGCGGGGGGGGGGVGRGGNVVFGPHRNRLQHIQELPHIATGLRIHRRQIRGGHLVEPLLSKDLHAQRQGIRFGYRREQQADHAGLEWREESVLVVANETEQGVVGHHNVTEGDLGGVGHGIGFVQNHQFACTTVRTEEIGRRGKLYDLFPYNIYPTFVRRIQVQDHCRMVFPINFTGTTQDGAGFPGARWTVEEQVGHLSGPYEHAEELDDGVVVDNVGEGLGAVFFNPREGGGGHLEEGRG